MRKGSSTEHLTTIIIIGGGLAGIMAARRVSSEGIPSVLIDQSLPEAQGKLGGFARFSGAKFSLPPAGMGLLNVAGDKSRLLQVIQNVLMVLGIAEDAEISRMVSDIDEDTPLSDSVFLRRYKSILLTQQEMGSLIDRKAIFPDTTSVLKATCTRIKRKGEFWEVAAATNRNKNKYLVRGRAVIFAGGRIGAHLLTNVGLKTREGKGAEIGVRIEVPELSTLSRLRELGSDAKLLYKNCRTFCLNYPGQIYRYPFEGIMVAGGISKDAPNRAANVGLLYRDSQKENRLSQIRATLEQMPSKILYQPHRIRGKSLTTVFGIISNLFGKDVATELNEFKINLADLNLVDWSKWHIVHLPELEWYWPIFGKENSCRTEYEHLYVVGDVSGHARGLLQAAVSGWLGAEELLGCI